MLKGQRCQIVYLDASKPAGTMVWIAAADGSSKRLVGDLLGPGIRTLDLRGSLLAVADGNDLVTLNLVSGDIKRLSVGTRIQSAYIANDTTVFYSTHPGCGPVEKKTMIGSFTVPTEMSEQVADMGDWPGAEVLSVQRRRRRADHRLARLRPWHRAKLWLVNAKTGDTNQIIPVDGCGWAAVSPSGTQALLTYDLSSSGAPTRSPICACTACPTARRRRSTSTKDAPSRHPFVYAPDGKRAAFGLALSRDVGGRSAEERRHLDARHGQSGEGEALAGSGAGILGDRLEPGRLEAARRVARGGEHVLLLAGGRAARQWPRRSPASPAATRRASWSGSSGCRRSAFSLTAHRRRAPSLRVRDAMSDVPFVARRLGRPTVSPGRARLDCDGLVVLHGPGAQLAQLVELLALVGLQPADPLGRLQLVQPRHDLRAQRDLSGPRTARS